MGPPLMAGALRWGARLRVLGPKDRARQAGLLGSKRATKQNGKYLMIVGVVLAQCFQTGSHEGEVPLVPW